MIKLIAIDLDGTLLKDDKTISERNITTLKAAKAQGVKVVLCTGRPLNSVLAHLETLGLTDPGDYAVTFNGGLVQANDTGEILSQDVMSVADAKDIYELTSRLEIPLDAVAGDYVYRIQPQPVAYPSMYDQLNKILIFEDRTFLELAADQVINKMVSAIPAEYLEEKLPQVPADYHDRYNIVRSGEFLFEFLPKHVSKANGLAKLGALLNIEKSEMMALGDEENDLAMIEYVGLGVAMANATAELKGAAQYITETNENHGVALAVEKFVLLPTAE
ncbi:Cof-type HAD-IIB family hydrolase [Vagococcus salmoninarum]|uniref:Cof-type HAD-IIB family hydrolase n=1 Tax=Vagococcus salmoninarum TaxID=2739 RepID=UPI001881491C|nr:Cof-type HAD-IIB family hydrolase [Vagococcus salmoninarum]MBE9387739.1 HAD family phosphatase [Vagococcus salmoninarum]